MLHMMSQFYWTLEYNLHDNTYYNRCLKAESVENTQLHKWVARTHQRNAGLINLSAPPLMRVQVYNNVSSF